MADIVTFGESMLRLSTARGDRLARTDGLDVHVGGAESNVAVTAQHLGLDAAWLSKLPDTVLGDRIEYGVASEGVTTHVARTDDGRAGTYYLEPGGDPRGTAVHYDRSDAAFRSTLPDELPLETVRDAGVFFTSGITPALSGVLAKTTSALLTTASEAGATTAFDVNYRSKLWGTEQARATLTGYFEDVDVLFVAYRDAERLLDYEGGAETVGRDLEDRYDVRTVVVTRGEDGALAVHDGRVSEQSVFDAETVDPVGTGDAFVGGFLTARSDGHAVADALTYGAATAALKRTVTGDSAVLSRSEVERVIEGRGGGISR